MNQKWISAYRDAMSFRASHYFVSFMSEASSVAAGFGYKPPDGASPRYIFLFERFISLFSYWHCVSSFWNFQNGMDFFKISCLKMPACQLDMEEVRKSWEGIFWLKMAHLFYEKVRQWSLLASLDKMKENHCTF